MFLSKKKKLCLVPFLYLCQFFFYSTFVVVDLINERIVRNKATKHL